MAQLIQFPCPVCASILRLPFESGGRRGPCPSCGHDIVAPDPLRGTPAHLPAVHVPQVVPVQEFRPFQESIPLVPPAARVEVPDFEPFANEPPSRHEAEEITLPAKPPSESPAPSTATEPAPPVEQVPTASCPHRAMFLPAMVLTAVISLLAGYLAGSRPRPAAANPPPSTEAAPAIKVEKSEPAPAPPATLGDSSAAAKTEPILVKPAAPVAEPVAEPVKPKEEPKPEPAPPAAPQKTSAMAEAALKAFLEAPDWSTRAAHVLFPDKVRAAMEAYSRTQPDGPTAFESLSVENSYTDKQSGSTLFIFKVVTPNLPSGFPVAVSETRNGWNVDWQTFVEFRDDHFKKFADGPPGKSGRFHLITTTPPAERAASTENEHFAPILLDPPMPGRQRMAYVRKSTDLHAKLKAATANGAIFTPVLEVAKRETPDRRSYLEIVSIAATDWLPVEP